MKTLVYKIEPITMRIPFDTFVNLKADNSKEYLDVLADYIEDHLDPVPEYASRGINVRNISLTRGCTDAIVTYEKAVAVKEARFVAEIKEIVERNGLEILHTRFGWEVDTAFYEVVLKGDFDLIFTEESLKKEQAIAREISNKYRTLGLMFKIHS